MNNLDELRKEIDQIDDDLKDLFLKRMDLVNQIKQYKEDNNLPVVDNSRENKLKERLLKDVDDRYINLYEEFINNTLSLSKEYQNNNLVINNLVINNLVINNLVIREENCSQIIYQKNCLKKLDQYFDFKHKIILVVDENLYKYVYKYIKNYSNIIVYILPTDENDKDIYEVERLINELIKKDFAKDDWIIALGGGVTLDLAGFVGSIYKRGINVAYLPSTVLAMVDASIGGKTGINHLEYKNMIGSFALPKKIIIDTTLIDTLDNRQFMNGIIESLKMGLVLNGDLANLILNSNDLKLDLDNIIKLSIETKIKVIKNDYKDNNQRMVLNFGHTIGHAIEILSNGNLLHGEAVGIGMLYASSGEVHNKLMNFLNKYQLPVSYNATNDEIINKILNDKKIRNNMINFVYAEQIGKYEIKQLSIEQIKEILNNGENI